MTGKVGIIWGSQMMFSCLVEDCGCITELITPHLLAAPYFRRSYSALIIPGGFAHPDYSTVLHALRASKSRIRRYIRSGGTILVFGAGSDRPDAYDWLSVRVSYQFGFFEGIVECENECPLSCITEDCPDLVSADGILHLPDISAPLIHGASSGEEKPDLAVCLCIRGSPVLIDCRSGLGRIIITTLHEYPSKRFIREFCISGSETLL